MNWEDINQTAYQVSFMPSGSGMCGSIGFISDMILAWSRCVCMTSPTSNSKSEDESVVVDMRLLVICKCTNLSTDPIVVNAIDVHYSVWRRALINVRRIWHNTMGRFQALVVAADKHWRVC